MLLSFRIRTDFFALNLAERSPSEESTGDSIPFESPSKQAGVNEEEANESEEDDDEEGV